MPKIVHQLIAETSKAIAREAYESLAMDNHFFKEWPHREQFVSKNWRMFVDDARRALLTILSDPSYPEEMKKPVYEAMLKDGAQRDNPKDPWRLN